MHVMLDLRRTAPRRRLTVLALALSCVVAVPAAGQTSASAAAPRVTVACAPLAPQLAAQVDAGWRLYRGGDAAAADSTFGRVLALCPDDRSALVGRGYAATRMNDLSRAAALLDRALAAAPADYDALTGRGMLAWRQGDPATARRAFEAVLRTAPRDSVARSYLERLGVVDTTRLRPYRRPTARVVVARAGRRVLEVSDGRGGWRPHWIKALNVGAALPGRHPSEFPADAATYERWIAMAAEMNVNTLRVYTIHPPHFYRALRRWNLAHPASPMWLIHGVWTELPPGPLEERYDDPAWSAGFRAEMRNVVDVLHGRAAIAARPGHAWGLYDADVSPWTLAYITGREWEPYSVAAYARNHPERTSFRGRWVTVDSGNPMEAWLAAETDYLVGYEMQRWNTQRPVAYTNWPTLDPLHHPTESTTQEEEAIRRARGEQVTVETREFDNDAIALDATRMRPTAGYVAGTFASYHAYPYYPDFMVYDPGYARARSSEGPSHYFGYLRELVAHHGDMPVVISEYGVPSSRGNAHLQPQGWHHGGHDEQAQAAINARLTREIHEAGAAGAGLFAIIDEWFKKNWLVIDFEQPLERNRLWLNALDAEQNYGVIAMRAGHRDSVITVDGVPDEWGERGRWYGADSAASSLPAPLRLRGLRVAHDPAYVYLRIDVDSIDWARGRYLVGIDTYDASRGDRRLPHGGAAAPTGLEFALDLRGPADSRLLVDRPYNPYARELLPGATPPTWESVYHPPFQSVANDDGSYDTLFVAVNRRRFGRDGQVFPEQRIERNLLRHARQQQSTLADWYADPSRGVIEIRVPWGMLHVLDPSSRQVLHGRADSPYPSGIATDGFRFVVQSYDPADPGRPGGLLPRAGRDAALAMPPLWSWPGWEEPQWHEERKPLFDSMRKAFGDIP